MDVKEIRSKVFAYFQKRNLPTPEKWNDERVASFAQTVMKRGSVERSYTRSANLRAVGGPTTESAAPVTAPVTDASRAACQQRAKAVLDSIAEEDLRRQKQILSASLL